MGLHYTPQTTTPEQFAQIFALERTKDYPSIDAFVAKTGFDIGRERLEDAARVLCCPFKAAPPNWQHGRVIYAVLRERYAELSQAVMHVDIGTAKGFSALCARWAIDDAGLQGEVHSADVMPPKARVRRSTPVECDGLKTLFEIVAPWPDAKRISFYESTGIDLLRRLETRIHSAFVDGKHSTDAVSAEWRLLADRQIAGDVAIFDDVQMPAVSAGLKGAKTFYDFEKVALVSVHRAYVIGRRK
jgi:hypothetical protein